jgi:hypothetical protein
MAGDLGLGLAYGGDAAAQRLRQIILDRAAAQQQQFQNQTTTREQDRADQVAAANDEIRRAQLQSLQDERQAKIEAGKQGIANSVESALSPGDTVAPEQAAALKGALRGNLIQTNAPAAGGQFADPSMPTDYAPGQQPGDVYKGNDKQRTDQEQKVLRGRLLADPSLNARERLSLEMENAGMKVPAGIFSNPGGAGEIKDTGNGMVRIGPDNTVTPILSGGKPVQGYHPPVQPVVVQTSAGPQILDRSTGTAKPITDTTGSVVGPKVGATVENRLASAKAVNQTGQDIINQLSDPTVAAMVGPALGRFNTVRDFIGNPPPELSELAGEIESYALANMGVHGMRSAQGAEQIKALLDRKHTPESLIRTIKGLSKFSAHFMENEGGGSAPAAPKPTAAELLKKYGG